MQLNSVPLNASMGCGKCLNFGNIKIWWLGHGSCQNIWTILSFACAYYRAKMAWCQTTQLFLRAAWCQIPASPSLTEVRQGVWQRFSVATSRLMSWLWNAEIQYRINAVLCLQAIQYNTGCHKSSLSRFMMDLIQSNALWKDGVYIKILAG